MNKIWEVRVSTSKNIRWCDMEYPPKIITKWQKLYSPPRKLRAGNQLPVLFLEKSLCTHDLLPACKIFIQGLDVLAGHHILNFGMKAYNFFLLHHRYVPNFFDLQNIWSVEYICICILWSIWKCTWHITWFMRKLYFFWCSFTLVKEGAIYFFSIYFSLFLQIF